MKLIEIIGLEEKHAKLLGKEGVNNVEDLVPLTYYQIRKLARKIGVSVKLLDTWQEHADLMRVEGINPKLANALNLIGIDSLKELAYRNSKNTFEKLKALKKENLKVITKIPTLANIEVLIKKAKKIAEIPPKGEKVKKKPVPEKSSAPDIPTTPDYKPFEKFEKNYGKYSSEYWNNKWTKIISDLPYGGAYNYPSRQPCYDIIKQISQEVSDYDKWYRVAFAISNTFTHDIGEKYFMKLCELDGDNHNEIESKNLLVNCYETTGGDIKFQSIYHYAQELGYKPKKN